jgi:predicted nucleic acid-binding protein
MIAIDTSSVARFLGGIDDRDTMLVQSALQAKAAVLPPVVVVELLSNPAMPAEVQEVIGSVPLLEIREGYWQRAGKLRAILTKRRLKAALADCLIAQACIDEDVPLVTYDRDFRHFRELGLKLL